LSTISRLFKEANITFIDENLAFIGADTSGILYRIETLHMANWQCLVGIFCSSVLTRMVFGYRIETLQMTMLICLA